MVFLSRNQHNAAWRNPFYEMERLQREMNRFLDPMLSASRDGSASLLDGFWSPAVDVVDKEDSIVVKADLPGLAREDVDVSIENNVLTIRGEKKRGQELLDGEVIRAERYYGGFYRAFTLPSTADADKIQASFNNGVLELVILKKEEAKPKQIKIDVK